MRLKTVSVLLVLVLMASAIPTSLGNSNGRYSSGNGCGCHYGSSATVSMSGHPSSYVPGTTYTLSISVSNGVSGSAGGFSLDANKGTLTTGGSVGIMAVKVNSAGTSATHTTSSYRSWSVDWIAPSAGSGQVQFRIAGMTANGNGGTSGDAWDTTTITVPEGGPPPSNNPPSASDVQLSPSNPVTLDTLSLTYSYQDSDNDPESGTKIRWYKDNQLVSSRNDQTTVPSSITSKGESWNVTVTPSDGTDDGTPVHSSNLVIVNSIPIISSAEITPSEALESDNLSLIYSSSDADSDTLTVSDTEWYVDGSKVSAFDGDLTIPSVAIRDGDVWYAKIKVNDGETDSDWFTTPDINVGSDNTPPTVTSVSITGGPYYTTDDLIATAQASDIDNDELTYEWDWPGTSGGVSSATLPSFYTSKGESWKVRVRVTDGEEYSEWMESSAVLIRNSAPVLTTLEIDQETVYFQNEATYTYDAYDADGDQIQTTETWSNDGEIVTLTLSVYDDEMVNSNTLTDTVILANSLPTLSYDGPLSQTALVDLAPSIISEDANGDNVILNWSWMRNGFMTDEIGNSISANKLGAGDIWTLMVTPNDGEDDGPMLIVDFTITNTPPVATITPPDSLIRGALVTYSASDSSDVDGAVVNAIWSIDGIIVHSGMTYTFVMLNEVNIELRAIDDLGASDIVTQTFFGTPPPVASNVNAELEDRDVVLTWRGNAQEWAIVHNGEQIDIVDGLTYKHTPTIIGMHNYSILAVVDGQVIQDDSPSVSDSVELSANLVPESPGPSETAGLVFSIVLLMIGLIGIAYSFLPRRD